MGQMCCVLLQGSVKSSGVEASDNAGKKRNSNSTEASGGPVNPKALMVNPGRTVMPGEMVHVTGMQLLLVLCMLQAVHMPGRMCCAT